MILDQHESDPPTPKKIWDSIVLWRFQEQFLKKGAQDDDGSLLPEMRHSKAGCA